MVYFAFLALSVVSVLALGTFLALMVKYPGSSAALADVEKDFLLKRRVVSESMAGWFKTHELGRFMRVSLGLLFLVSIISTALLVGGP